MRKYQIVLYWSEEDRSFIAEVPELPGCMSDGSSYQDALQNVETVIDEWIETARFWGREIPKPQGRFMLAINFQPEMFFHQIIVLLRMQKYKIVLNTKSPDNHINGSSDGDTFLSQISVILCAYKGNLLANQVKTWYVFKHLFRRIKIGAFAETLEHFG
jgi:predicted RNase H-like HicB family nuclease